MDPKYYYSLLLLLMFCFITKGLCQTKVFRLEDYGAVKGGVADNRKALLHAWDNACKWKGGRSKLEISSGTYFLKPVVFIGPCNGPIEFQNSGILKAPLGFKYHPWIEFRYIDRLTLSGSGLYDGQGPPSRDGSSRLSTMLQFSFITNSEAHNVKLINSQGAHFILFAVNNTLLNHITISSPEDSHNTDGIKIGASNGVTITNTNIASGDDCVAILTGSNNISISDVNCGPGHGISIGSMGGSLNERVNEVFVKHCNFYGTTNGLRIKTKKTDKPGLVSNIIYEDIYMSNVYNPIIFDQNYCVPGSCGQGRTSRVEIRDVKFKNIRGTSKTKVAVNLECSKSTPCKKIELQDIDLRYSMQQEETISNCLYASGNSYGFQIPKPCF